MFCQVGIGAPNDYLFSGNVSLPSFPSFLLFSLPSTSPPIHRSVCPSFEGDLNSEAPLLCMLFEFMQKQCVLLLCRRPCSPQHVSCVGLPTAHLVIPRELALFLALTHQSNLGQCLLCASALWVASLFQSQGKKKPPKTQREPTIQPNARFPDSCSSFTRNSAPSLGGE